MTSRTVAGTSGEKNERYAIATGVLGGFGGFLDESFRAHDYQLGRRNCQKFLRDIFSVGEGHPFVGDWPAGVADRFRKQFSLAEQRPRVADEQLPFAIVGLDGELHRPRFSTGLARRRRRYFLMRTRACVPDVTVRDIVVRIAG